MVQRKTLYNDHGSARRGGDYEALITLIYFLHEALGGACLCWLTGPGLCDNIMTKKTCKKQDVMTDEVHDLPLTNLFWLETGR